MKYTNKKGWRGEPIRHALASKGFPTQVDVYVGGREEPKVLHKAISKTDIPSAFHTTLDKGIAFYFADKKDKDYVYRLNLDYSDLPDEKVLEKDDWTMDMVETFAKKGWVDLNELEKTNPDVAENIRENARVLGDRISAEGIGSFSNRGVLSIFFYPPKEMVEKLPRSERGSLNEQEVAILDKDYLRKLWRDRERIHKSEVNLDG